MRVAWVGRFSAVLFDLDGVLTPTAEVHRRAWKALFEEYFARHGIGPAYTEQDYFDHIDGKPRYDGVRDLLASRGITLPFGSTTDPIGAPTLAGLGNRKNHAFNEVLARDGVGSFPGTAAVLEALSEAGVRMAVVSSSHNARPVLEASGLIEWFSVVVDGVVAQAEALAGKPDPATFLHAARMVGVAPGNAVVVEDAVAGVRAGRAGAFGWVVGMDRGSGADALGKAGADSIIANLETLLTLDPPAAWR